MHESLREEFQVSKKLPNNLFGFHIGVHLLTK